MTPSAHGMQRTVGLVVLTLALATASQPLVAADQTVEAAGGAEPVFVCVWTGPTTQVVLTIVALPPEEPEPAAEDDKDKNGVILDDGAPF